MLWKIRLYVNTTLVFYLHCCVLSSLEVLDTLFSFILRQAVGTRRFRCSFVVVGLFDMCTTPDSDRPVRLLDFLNSMLLCADANSKQTVTERTSELEHEHED
jgi:hypothetical protein